jgi:hypothetical protein
LSFSDRASGVSALGKKNSKDGTSAWNPPVPALMPGTSAGRAPIAMMEAVLFAASAAATDRGCCHRDRDRDRE